MAVQLIKCDWLALPGGRVERGPLYLTIQEDKVASITQTPPSWFSEAHPEILHAHLVTPGFIDLHTHGVGEYIFHVVMLRFGYSFCAHLTSGGADDVIDFWQHPGLFACRYAAGMQSVDLLHIMPVYTCFVLS